MLRFGRNLGADPLPANAAHWREIETPAGRRWADLNWGGSFKFSDADFLPVAGWNFFDDDTDHLDQVCQSVELSRWVRNPDPKAPGRETQEHLNARLGDPGVRTRLRRAICFFPTEWDRSTVVKRHLNQREKYREKGIPLSDEEWNRFEAHAEAMTFHNLPEEYKNARWRLHPAEFIEWMRKCGWMSSEELAQLLPRKSVSDPDLSWRNAYARAHENIEGINRLFRKYSGASRVRQVHLLAQIFTETGILRTLKEGGEGKAKKYGAFYGRGYLQLTWAANYEKYRYFKGINSKMGVTYSDGRINQLSVHMWEPNGKLEAWYPRFDPEKIYSSVVHAGESAGHFWLSKHFAGTTNINRAADLGCEPINIGYISWLVNGGQNGYVERQQFAMFLKNAMLDDEPLQGAVRFSFPPLKSTDGSSIVANFPPKKTSQSLEEKVFYDRQIP